MSIDSHRISPIPMNQQSLRARLRNHLQSPLLRNGYALVFNSVATSALGMLYWMLAANFYSAEVVGINAALINAMIFLAQAAQLNLTNGVNRFLPVAGTASRRFVLTVYALILAATPLVCLIYFVGLKSWAPLLDSLFANRTLMLGFVLATMAWCIFAMQDSVLIGMRQATWVPLENLLFALAKIALLVAVATLLPELGIFLSWVVPMALLILPVNWFIFRQLVPKHIQATEAQSEPLKIGAIARYVGGDYLGSLVWTATTGLLPILVLERAGATASAYFSIAWTIAYSLYLVSRNMGMSLISEASLDRDKLAHYSQRTLLQTFKLLLPVTLGVVVMAPWLLRLFGKEYSSEATLLLRYLALSALPAVITSIYVSVARVQRRVVAVFVVQGLLCGITLLLSWFLLERIGITAIGVAWLISQSVVAIALLLTDFRIGIDNEALLGFLSQQRNGWSLWRAKRQLHRLQPLVRSILSQLQQQSGEADWQQQQILPTLGDVTVVSLGRADGERLAMLKFPGSALAVRYSQEQQRALALIQANPHLGEWRRLVPRLLLAGVESGQHYLVESIVQGTTLDKVLAKSQERQQLLHTAAAAIAEMHRATALATVVDAVLFQLWVEKPLAELQTLYTGSRDEAKRRSLAAIEARLRHDVMGQQVAVGWGHGDFAACNILVDATGRDETSSDQTNIEQTCWAVTGIVDWEQMLTNDHPMLDIVFLLLTARAQEEAQELGAVVANLLAGSEWNAFETEILANIQAQLPGSKLSDHTLILLTWLRHVSMTIDKSERYRHHPIWRRNNIERVLTGFPPEGRMG